MKILKLSAAVRQVSLNIPERSYLDFTISGQSLKTLLNLEKSDLITLFGWGENKDYTKKILRIFRLQEKSNLQSGRIMLYVCPECGDIGCGAVTVRIEDLGDRIIWKDFGYETDHGGVTKKYSDIPQVEFERQSYFQAFSKL